MSSDYNFSLTTFSSSGKLGQIENALAAVSQGATSIGIKASNAVVLVSEKKTASCLIDESSIEKVSKICASIGATYSGVGPDMRLLLKDARKEAQAYLMVYNEYPSAKVLAQKLAATIQEYTQSGGVRPFGVSILVAGANEQQDLGLYQIDPSGIFCAWKATAIGRNSQQAKAFLERRWHAELEQEDAIHIALLALKEAFDGQMSAESVEIGVVSMDARTFTKLKPEKVKEYLDNL